MTGVSVKVYGPDEGRRTVKAGYMTANDLSRYEDNV